MATDDISAAIESHVRKFFRGHEVEDFIFPFGPIQDLLPRFRVLRVAPGPVTELWTYVSVGAWEVGKDNSSLEFIIIAPEENPRHVELLAMIAYYHNNHSLGLGHTFPIGEPWLDDSQCGHMLVSLPYPYGKELEICDAGNGHVHLYWLLPITAAEREFGMANGLEALEELFERQALEYWKQDRSSTV